MATDMEAAVERGAVLLDEHWPAWDWKIDTDALNMGSDSLCVLGQLAGHYAYGVAVLDIERPWEYGFTVDPLYPPHMVAYARLSRLWVRKVEQYGAPR